MLTTAQLATLKADIAANTNTVLINGVATQIKLVPASPDNAAQIAGWYNQAASPAWTVWRDLDMAVVLGLITYANMTPLDAVPTTPDLSVQVWIARAQACQGKQFNLQNLTLGRTVAPMKRTNYRAALQDCLTNVPAGASGALLSANWTAVRDAAKGTATNGEKLFSSGTGSAASPADLVVEGALDASDVLTALSS
jgi:hypothetical protein